MAHDLRCKRCDWTESAHDFPDDYKGVCKAYQSPDPEWELAEWERIRTPKERTYSDAVWILTPYGPIDIGS
jgi:hypothetical protein